MTVYFSMPFSNSAYQLLFLYLKLSPGKHFHFSDIRQASGAIMYLLEPKGGGGGMSVGLFYCLILSETSFKMGSRKTVYPILPYTVKKKVSHFPVPSRDVTHQTFPGRELINYSMPGRVW